MKKIIIFTLVSLFVLAGCSSGKDKGTIVVGTTGQSYPNSYEKDGKLVGYDIEVFEKAAQKAGYKVKWVKADFSGIMGQLDSGRVDSVANAVAVTDERKDKYQFSTPYSYIGSQIVTSTKNKNINQFSDLKGKTVAGVMGSNHTQALTQFNKDKNYNMKTKTYENRESAMLDLDNHRIDGYINSSSVLSAEKNKKIKTLNL
ncbi:transporter substrate-binding domain-containing protein [Staphylococcus shinii]|uniref:transporter substrate-binding domain-containing protein n=1 Tax=Staphylococcus shinii TaxID=2912228 RepID=UPI00298EE49E|nr:transporter substrate-binding domain-containing protein [Staphylococcus shinii]MDW8563770.1 transporter substrate-binding domain-containing protein [Staphylococcus shinii]